MACVSVAAVEKRLVYQRAYMRERKQRNRRLLQRFKTFKGCRRCGYREHPDALQFHHRNGVDGRRQSLLCLGRPALKRELAKCDVLCANCHSIDTVAVLARNHA